MTQSALNPQIAVNLRFFAALLALLISVGAIALLTRVGAIKRLVERGGDWPEVVVPQLFALLTFLSGVILVVSGSTPARAGRMGWLNDILPIPIIVASAYFASIAGVGLIVLARGLQRRLDVAYHITIWLLAGGVVFSLASALDIEQAVVLSIMLVVLLPARRFFYRKASIFEERFTAPWIIAIIVVLGGAAAIAIGGYEQTHGVGDVFWKLHHRAPADVRQVRALLLAAVLLVLFAVARLIRPTRRRTAVATTQDLECAVPVVDGAIRANAHLAFLGDKALMFNETNDAFIMYGVNGLSWVALGDPVGNVAAWPELIDDFVHRCDREGGWPVFYRVTPPLLHLYLEYALAVVKLGEIARVSLPGFSLEGSQRRNLRRVHRKAVDDACTFEVVSPGAVPELVPQLSSISNSWLQAKQAREKRFSLGNYDTSFLLRSELGVVRKAGVPVAFVTLWKSGQGAEVEVDLMRYGPDAPPGIMRYALIEAMFWAKAQGFSYFNLGMAPLSGIRASAVAPLWNQLSLSVRGVGERYYNFKGLREFKEWFYPEWEPSYLVSPGGVRRGVVLADISALISGGIGGIFRK